MSLKFSRVTDLLSKLNHIRKVSVLMALTCIPLSAQPVVNQVDPLLMPPADSASAARSGERNSISPAVIAANAGVITALVVLALVNSHAHSHAH